MLPCWRSEIAVNVVVARGKPLCQLDGGGDVRCTAKEKQRSCHCRQSQFNTERRSRLV